MSYIYGIDFDDFLPRGLAKAMAGAMNQSHWIYGKWLISAASWDEANEAMRAHGCVPGGLINTTPTFSDFTTSLLAAGPLPVGSVAIFNGWYDSPIIKVEPVLDDHQRIVPAGVLIGHRTLTEFVPV